MQLQSFLFLLVDVNIAALGLLQDCLKAIERHQAVSVNIQKNQAMILEKLFAASAAPGGLQALGPSGLQSPGPSGLQPPGPSGLQTPGPSGLKTPQDETEGMDYIWEISSELEALSRTPTPLTHAVSLEPVQLFSPSLSPTPPPLPPLSSVNDILLEAQRTPLLTHHPLLPQQPTAAPTLSYQMPPAAAPTPRYQMPPAAAPVPSYQMPPAAAPTTSYQMPPAAAPTPTYTYQIPLAAAPGPPASDAPTKATCSYESIFQSTPLNSEHHFSLQFTEGCW